MVNNTNLNFKTYAYADLTKQQLYQVLKLRQIVFIVEQECAYLDMDAKDFDSLHVLAYNDDEELLAYARLLPKAVSYPDYVSVGRVVTSPKVRGQRLGYSLMEFCMQELKRLWPSEGVKLQAQSYLLDFYKSFGFSPVGEEYLEDDIPHTDMVLQLSS